MAERDFTKLLMAGFDECRGVHAYKIPDMPVGRPVGGVRGDGMRFNPERPYDIFCLQQLHGWPFGVMHAIEVKQVREQSWRTDGSKSNSIKEDQEQALVDVLRKGGLGWIVLHWTFEPSAGWRKKRLKVDRYVPEDGQPYDMVFAIRSDVVKFLREVHHKDVLQLEWFEDNALRLPKIGSYYDPSPLFSAGQVLFERRLAECNLEVISHRDFKPAALPAEEVKDVVST